MDIDSKEVLEKALIDFDGTLIFVSHDRYFINRLATKVLEISEKESHLYLGDYDYYLMKKYEQEENTKNTQVKAEETSSTKSSSADNYKNQKASQKEIRRLRRRIEEVENQLEEAERETKELSLQMTQINEAQQLIELQKELDNLSDCQERLMKEWETLSEELEKY
ncbi:hypothetical protein STRMA_0869 [Streptococcus macacae NCTC 11558]|uniref:ABC transporter Uup C-terminal domain-containing protein n=1 Tax=Streptococcus macacae NCTC 11558 TaxID=764298 RepID=G5JVL3_9STRE|nr:hypothetical protein STRMA_0869 [Streptococcus macacae NCTC 11558]